jgi:hypothetical protein
MMYRILASVLLIVALGAVAVLTESGSQPNTSAPSTSGTSDDSAMKSLKID